MSPIENQGFNSSHEYIRIYYIDEMDTDTCRYYAHQRWQCDFYATAIGASLVVILGVLGNAGTLFTLSGRRLTTATFVYYRAIAWADLCRCVFVFTYVLRVLVPFRRYYWTTWYEAHVMYFIIGSLGFISTSLAVLLCFRLCYCIVQSRRMKKMHTSAQDTKRIIYGVATGSFFINIWLCFERQVRLVTEDECSFSPEDTTGMESLNRTDSSTNTSWNSNDSKKYALAPSEFSYAYSSLLKAVHNIPVVILLILLTSTLALLILCIAAFSGVKHQEILSNKDSSARNSKTFRTQRQLCRLFLVLSLSYAFGLLPSLIYEFLLNNDSIFGAYAMSNTTANATLGHNQDSYRVTYENVLAAITRRQISATILNVIQNFSHAISFYIYVSCSEEFRNEFFCKLRRLGCDLRTAYSSVRFSRISTRNTPMSPLIRTNTTPVSNRRLVASVVRSQFLTRPFNTRTSAPNTEVIPVTRNTKSRIQIEKHGALLSENEGDEWETWEPEATTRRTQSDARFLHVKRLGGIARELSCQFYTKVGTLNEEIVVDEGQYCLVFQPKPCPKLDMDP